MPAQTSKRSFCPRKKSAVAARFRNEPAKTIFAFAHACNARVPLVVVETMVFPGTFSGVNSRGELPKSKSIPPDCAARIFTPSRSPASKTSGCRRRSATASAISLTGIISCAPCCKAVTNVLVARRMSKTTQAVLRKSRWASAGNSVGDRRVSIFILGAGDSIIFPGQNSTLAFAAWADDLRIRLPHPRSLAKYSSLQLWRDGRVAEGAGLLSQIDHFVTVRDTNNPRANTAPNHNSQKSPF